MRLISVKEALNNRLEKFALEEKNRLIYQLWDKEIGILSKHCSLLGINNGCLMVEVNSSPALQEFSLQKQKIIERINTTIGEKIIQDIKFRITEGRCYSGKQLGRRE